ncbi:hypothetical protein C8258_18440 [Nocardia sp. MDA0666]|nr:hypothetical protein C8258_18440 [Nocardia sp. MDA0666]
MEAVADAMRQELAEFGFSAGGAVSRHVVDTSAHSEVVPEFTEQIAQRIRRARGRTGAGRVGGCRGCGGRERQCQGGSGHYGDGESLAHETSPYR